MKLTSTILGVILFLCSVHLATGADKGKGKAKGKKSHASVTAVQVGVSIFSESDRQVIGQYVRGLSTDSLPPGLAKRSGNLPPGLQKQLQRNGQLPPGLAKKIAAFPVELERRLPPLKPGLVRGVIEGRAVIYNAKTSVILDIFSIF